MQDYLTCVKWLILIRKLGKYGKKKNPKNTPSWENIPLPVQGVGEMKCRRSLGCALPRIRLLSCPRLGPLQMWWILLLNVKVVLHVFNAPRWNIFEPEIVHHTKIYINELVGSWFQNSDIQPHFSEAKIYLNSICENLVHNTRRLPWNGLAILFSPRNILSFCQVTPAHGIHLSVCIFSPRVWCSRGRQTKYFTKGMEDSEQIFFSVKQPVSPAEFFLEISS